MAVCVGLGLFVCCLSFGVGYCWLVLRCVYLLFGVAGYYAVHRVSVLLFCFGLGGSDFWYLG